jgi:hypothetical protein
VPSTTPGWERLAGDVGAGRLVAQGAGQAEVEDLHASLGRDLDVVRLEVAVDDALLVGFLQTAGDLARDVPHLGHRHRPPRDELRQVVALAQFHHQEGHALRLFDAVDAGDVGVL